MGRGSCAFTGVGERPVGERKGWRDQWDWEGDEKKAGRHSERGKEENGGGNEGG
jgi:hypothetical protein